MGRCSASVSAIPFQRWRFRRRSRSHANCAQRATRPHPPRDFVLKNGVASGVVVPLRRKPNSGTPISSANTRRHCLRRGDQSRIEKAAAACAALRDDLPELINICMEGLTKNHFELPAFSTLDRVAQDARAEPAVATATEAAGGSRASATSLPCSATAAISAHAKGSVPEGSRPEALVNQHDTTETIWMTPSPACATPMPVKEVRELLRHNNEDWQGFHRLLTKQGLAIGKADQGGNPP